MWPNLTKKSQVSYSDYKLPELKEDGSNKSDFFCADVVGNKRFAFNYGGYPRSDLAIINEQSNLQVAKAMLQELPYGSANGTFDSSIPDQELLLGLKSKYLQTPSEIIGYIESELGRRQSLRAAEQSAESDDSKISFTSTSESVENDV